MPIFAFQNDGDSIPDRSIEKQLVFRCVMA
jgi:hypothetical protein